MRGAGFQPAPEICSADILRRKAFGRTGKHRTAAVSAEQKTAVIRGILFLSAIVVGAALLQKLLRIGKGSAVNDRLMGIFDDNMLLVRSALINAVDPFALIFVLPQRTDIEVVAQHFLNSDDAPRAAALQFRVPSLRLFPGDFVGSRGWDTAVCQMVGNALVSPSVCIQSEHLAHHLGSRRVDFISHCLCVGNAVSVGYSANPFAVFLSVGNDLLDFFAGIGDGKLVHQKLELDQHPLVFGGIVNIIADGDDSDAGITQRFQFEKPQTVAAGETREVFDNQNMHCSGHQLGTHPLICFSLGEGVAASVTICKHCQLRVGKVLRYIALDDFFLVFDAGILLLVFVEVNGDTRIAIDFQCYSPTNFISQIILYIRSEENARGNTRKKCL